MMMAVVELVVLLPGDRCCKYVLHVLHVGNQ